MNTLSIIYAIIVISYLVLSLLLSCKEIYREHKDPSFEGYPYYLTGGGYTFIAIVLIFLVLLLAPIWLPIALFWVITKIIKVLFS
jgi:hypothetical protein